MKSRTLHVWSSMIKINLASFYVSYAAKAFYIPPNFSCRSEIVTSQASKEDFHPRVTVDQASATESLYILVGLTLKLGHCITVFELG